MQDGYASFHKLSAKAQYALLAMMELARVWNQNKPLTVSEVAFRQPIPDRYLEHIFTLLRRGGLVRSQRGAKGGYVLTREPWQITLLDIIVLVQRDGLEEPEKRYRNGKVSEPSLGVERELVREVWQGAGSASQTVLNRYTLEDLRQKCDSRRQNHPMYYI